MKSAKAKKIDFEKKKINQDRKKNSFEHNSITEETIKGSDFIIETVFTFTSANGTVLYNTRPFENKMVDKKLILID